MTKSLSFLFSFLAATFFVQDSWAKSKTLNIECILTMYQYKDRSGEYPLIGERL